MHDLSLIGNQRNITSEINIAYILWYVMCSHISHLNQDSKPWKQGSRGSIHHSLKRLGHIGSLFLLSSSLTSTPYAANYNSACLLAFTETVLSSLCVSTTFLCAHVCAAICCTLTKVCHLFFEIVSVMSILSHTLSEYF